MMLKLKFLQFMTILITTFLVYIFYNYVRFVHFFDICKLWLFNDITDFQVYDFIVVGAGTAGATLATRLTTSGYKVLLLEAGGDAPPFLDIPLLAPLIQNTPYDWQYKTVPQENACKGLRNNESKWPMGKILGGSSRLNYMLHVRGHPLDYQEWMPEFNEYFTKYSGSLHISDLKWDSGVADIILEGLRELHQAVGNINDDIENGFMRVKVSMKNGKRWSTDKLLQELFENKCTIVTHAHVQKVLMESNRAVGVQFVILNKTFTAIAEKGVILSAGTIGTPKILMLSGIGPRQHLEDLNINVINDLPVGKHLIDHVLTGIDLVTINVSIGFNLADTLNPMSGVNYFFWGQGPWTFPGVEVLGTFHSALKINKSDVPDLQIMVMPLGVSKDNGVVLKESMGISEKVYDAYFAPISHTNTLTIAPVLLHPKSEGEIKLSSNNSFDPPLIDPKYLSHKDDIETLIDGVQFVKELVETNAMKSIGATIYKKQFPGCENEIFDTKKYWECYIQHLTLSSYHPAGTCRIGHVVDQTFKVYGTRNLYVADASILPSLPSGNINTAIVMIAEKAAHMIKQSTKVHMDSGRCYKPKNYYHLPDTII